APSWWMPGELAVELGPAGKLIRFRAIPQFKPDSPKAQAKPDWQQWFPKEFTGFDLTALEPVEDRGMTPPDAFDQLQVWRGGKPGGGGFYVQAAAFAGKPVYFEVFSRSKFERQIPKTQQNSTSRELGESMT